MTRQKKPPQYKFDQRHFGLLRQTYMKGHLESLIARVGTKMGLGKKLKPGRIDDIVSAVDERMPYLLSQFQFKSKWSTYLHRCIHRIMLNELYRSNAEATLEGTEEGRAKVFSNIADPRGGPSYKEEHENDRRNLARAMMKLPRDFRHVFDHIDIKGMTYQQYANHHKIPLGTVRSKLFRARKQLYQNLLEMHAITENQGNLLTTVPATAMEIARQHVASLSNRDKTFLYMHYARGTSHEEIAMQTHYSTALVKSKISTARVKLAGLLKTRDKNDADRMLQTSEVYPAGTEWFHLRTPKPGGGYLPTPRRKRPKPQE